MTAPGPVALIVIDVQRDFVPELPPGSAETLQIGNIRHLVALARAGGVPVVFIREVHHPSHNDLGREVDGVEPVHCLEGTPGADYIDDFGPLPTEYEVRKRRYSAFFGTDLLTILRGYATTTVVLVGGLTDVCVHYTAADAHQHDYYIRVVDDAVYGSGDDAHRAALAAMAYLQRDAVIDTAAAAAILRT